MIKKLCLIFVLVALMFSACYAVDGDVATFGSTWRIDSNGVLKPVDSDSGAGLNTPYEVATTGDTLTAVETGKTIILYPASASGTVPFNLPAVADGLNYSFVLGKETVVLNVNPYSSDQIMYVGCATGDSISSPGSTADSVKLISDGTRWYVTEMKGTWTDGN